MRKITYITIYFLYIALQTFSQCLTTPISPFPFVDASNTSTVFGGGTSISTTNLSGVCSSGSSSGTMPSSGNYTLPCNDYTITSGDVNADLTIYIKSGQILNVGYGWNLNGGKIINIYIENGGIFNYTNSGTLYAGKLYVWGILNITNNISIQAQSSLYVGSTGYISAVGKNITMPSGSGKFLLDGGGIEMQNFNINSNGNTNLMCIKNNGCAKITGNIFNDEDNAFSSDDGTGVLYWNNSSPSFSGNENLISTSNPLNVVTQLSSTSGSGGTDARFCSTTDVNLNSGGIVNATCKSKISYNTSSSTNKCNNPLPIFLTFFKTDLLFDGVSIQFGINNNLSNYGNFIIERSKDGINWEVVSDILISKNKYFNDYFIVDYNPNLGDNYYHLIEVKDNGERKVYAIDYIYNDDYKNHFTIYPNPSSNIFFITINSDESIEYKLEIKDVLDKTHIKYLLKCGVNEIKTNLSSGIYLIKLKLGHKDFNQKIIIY